MDKQYHNKKSHHPYQKNKKNHQSNPYPTEFATLRNGTIVEYWKKFSTGYERELIASLPYNRAKKYCEELNRHNKKGVY